MHTGPKSVGCDRTAGRRICGSYRSAQASLMMNSAAVGQKSVAAKLLVDTLASLPAGGASVTNCSGELCEPSKDRTSAPRLPVHPVKLPVDCEAGCQKRAARRDGAQLLRAAARRATPQRPPQAAAAPQRGPQAAPGAGWCDEAAGWARAALPRSRGSSRRRAPRSASSRGTGARARTRPTPTARACSRSTPKRLSSTGPRRSPGWM